MREAGTQLRSFASADRFLREVAGEARRPGYVLLGDEAFLQGRCRRGVLDALLPAEERAFALHDLDLGETSVVDALDLARTPSLMTPFQVFFLRNVKVLYGRGQKKEEFAAIEAYFRRPSAGALVLFVADHVSLPQDLRAMEMQDRERAERIRETLGESCGIVELQRVSAEDAAAWAMETAGAAGVRLRSEAARELVDALGADMLQLGNELEKLLLYAEVCAAGASAPGEAGGAGSAGGAGTPGEAGTGDAETGGAAIGVAEVELMVTSAKQRGMYELTEAISQKDAPRALALLGGLLNVGDAGEEAAIGHVFSLAKAFRQMLILNEKQVKDQRGLWAVLWPGFRVPGFAADALIAQARRYRDRGELRRGLRLIARADLELRSSPVSKRLVLERLVMRLAGLGRVEERAGGEGV